MIPRRASARAGRCAPLGSRWRTSRGNPDGIAARCRCGRTSSTWALPSLSRWWAGSTRNSSSPAARFLLYGNHHYPTPEVTIAETVLFTFKANGQDIKGESSQTSLGRANTIECTFYQQSVLTAREAGSGMATGRRQYEPLLIRKRIDKSSPLIAKALVENQ